MAIIERDTKTGILFARVSGFPGTGCQGKTVDELHESLHAKIETLLDEKGEPVFLPEFVALHAVQVDPEAKRRRRQARRRRS
jgi:predicted RNase H-like HicB family nuclease